LRAKTLNVTEIYGNLRCVQHDLPQERSRGEINKSFTFQHPGDMDNHTLVHLLSDKSVPAVATICGVTRRTIYRWCKEHGVARRTYRCPDQKLLRRLEANGILQKHIAATFGVCRWTIRLWCMKFGIAHHTTGQFRKANNRNIPAIHEEMPFGIGVLVSDDVDGL
jgi:transposase